MAKNTMSSWARDNRWLVAFVLVVLAGYTIGKDMALRDNRAEHAMIEER